ncbi:MAG: thioredoxin domain-containing protein [Gammaproteobacteria bacterium]|nr:thioredoxin domain-containing protein [Gammaproteobacteria bacterium]
MQHDVTATNRLISETSPYLLQHAHNPVDWFPWNEEALSLAQELNKPILLSIGYSACHWCHVMAHESFEDAVTAQVMNQLFINIKIDREERPDLDKIYQLAHQVLTQRGGGWPLTMILTPDTQTPFFAGTYFPKEPRHEMPAFVDVIKRIEGFYRHHKEDVDHHNEALLAVFRQVDASHVPGNEMISPAPIDEARCQLEKNYDQLFAGFGEAPKFPHPTNLSRLLRHWAATAIAGNPDKTALDMATTTLRAMAMGGVYDQLGGGFYRYSVDQEWMIPHFEKMLYDNGPLLVLYCEAWKATGMPLFERVALETAEWVMREMQSSEGGYYSTLDADSEGEEGRYYVWTPEAVELLLPEVEYKVFALHFGLNRVANFQSQWHLHVYESLENVADQLTMSVAEVKDHINAAKQTLFRVREERIRPGRDDKILTSWNGLMIKGLAMVGRRFQRQDVIRSAENALDFIKSTLWRNGRLLATYKDGKAHLMAYLDDYVYLIDAVLELLQARWRDGDLEFALSLAEVVLSQFEDKQNGGFYFTANDHEKLIYRPMLLSDEALPSGNGIAAQVLIRLGHVVGEARYLDAAERTLKAAWGNICRMPYAHNALLDAVEEYLYPTEIIILRGESPALLEWQQHCQQHYAPRRLVLAIPNEIERLPGGLGVRASKKGPVAYRCKGHQCSAPIEDLVLLDKVLSFNQV